MLEQYYYASEKLREMESGRVVCTQFVEHLRGKPVLAPLARPVGRALHRLGHRLEGWAGPPSDGDGGGLELRGKAG